MSDACVALIERIERDLRMEIANLDSRIVAESQVAVMTALVEEARALIAEMRALASSAVAAAEETVAAAEETADMIVEEAAEEAAEVAAEIVESVEEPESEETPEPLVEVEALPGELVEANPEEDKGPDRRSFFERPLFGSGR